jgi:hypothetical protein
MDSNAEYIFTKIILTNSGLRRPGSKFLICEKGYTGSSMNTRGRTGVLLIENTTKRLTPD